jgi:hypothetical protein
LIFISSSLEILAATFTAGCTFVLNDFFLFYLQQGEGVAGIAVSFFQQK